MICFKEHSKQNHEQFYKRQLWGKKWSAFDNGINIVRNQGKGEKRRRRDTKSNSSIQPAKANYIVKSSEKKKNEEDIKIKNTLTIAQAHRNTQIYQHYCLEEISIGEKQAILHNVTGAQKIKTQQLSKIQSINNSISNKSFKTQVHKSTQTHSPIINLQNYPQNKLNLKYAN